MIVVCDDEDRENEGDLTMAAQFSDPGGRESHGDPRPLGLPADLRDYGIGARRASARTARKPGQAGQVGGTLDT